MGYQDRRRALQEGIDQVDDEGVTVPKSATMNFVGDGVMVTRPGEDYIVTIPGNAGGDGAPLTFGGGNILASGTAERFLTPWYDSASAGLNEVFIGPWPYACVISRLRATWGAASGSVNVDVVFRIEAADTAVEFTALSDAGAGDNLVDSVSLPAGQRASIVVRKSAATGSAMDDFQASVRAVAS